MTELSIKNKILNYLSDGDWKYGGQIEDHIRLTDGHKASNASRRCRELEDEGGIESRYVKADGVANKVVQYRLKASVTPILPQGGTKTPCCYSFAKFKTHTPSCPSLQTVKLF